MIGFDNREFSDYLKPRLTTMDLPLHEMGYSSMKSLMRLGSRRRGRQRASAVMRTVGERVGSSSLYVMEGRGSGTVNPRIIGQH